MVWGKKKLGGILCESGFLGNRASYAILGMGINLKHERKDFPEEIRCQATSLQLITKKEIDKKKLLENLWPALNRWYGLFLDRKDEEIVHSFQEYSTLPLGKEIVVLTEKGKVSGTYAGINTQGGLVLDRKGRRRFFFSGEISLVKDKKGGMKCF